MGASESASTCRSVLCDWEGPYAPPCQHLNASSVHSPSDARGWLFSVSKSNIPRFLPSTLEYVALVGTWLAVLSIPLLLRSFSTRQPREDTSGLVTALVGGRTSLAAWVLACAGLLLWACMIAPQQLASTPLWSDLLECGAQGGGACVYLSMLCEPARFAGPVRHPANALSNLPYVWAAIYAAILAARGSSGRHSSNAAARDWRRLGAAFDAILGALLIWLSALSVAWHGTNCNWVHYFDWAAVNSVFSFFQIRYGAVVAGKWLCRTRGHVHALGGLALAFVAQCVRQQAYDAAAKMERGDFELGWPTAAARSASAIELAAGRSGEGALSGYGLALLALLPLLALPIPATAIATCGFRGCWGAAIASVALIVLSWAVDMGERWGLATGPCFTSGALSVVQATALFHVLTAGAIFFALVHVHSLDALVVAGLESETPPRPNWTDHIWAKEAHAQPESMRTNGNAAYCKDSRVKDQEEEEEEEEEGLEEWVAQRAGTFTRVRNAGAHS
jgi:hypothetical protein